MFFMRFALDVIHTDKQGTVLRILPGIKPWRLGPFVRKCRMAIELPAGTAARTGTVEGDVIVLATDGLTESRDSHGDLLTDSGALRLILESSPEPQRLADELVARVRKFARNKALDDLAVLVIRMYPPKATDAPR